ncbi:hypothetical protein BSKO_11819 [Bryopsis sp. KO-2023]|nr:hypothetical protein BSKO_11819 [Bryopsis sp. KO-2023]
MPSQHRRTVTRWGVPLLCIGALLIVILVPTSLSSVEYYEYGLVKKRSSGSMLLGKGVYGPGRYHLGPDFTFKKFQADAHRVKFEGLSVFTGDKLETLLDIDVIYFIKKDKLVELHNSFERAYRPVVEGRILDAIKNTAPRFDTAKFFENRTLIEAELLTAVKDRAAGVFVSASDLFLSRVSIPPEVQDRQLSVATQREDNFKEENIQQSLLMRQETARLVNEIDNQARLVVERSKANATLTVEKAEAEAAAIVEEARFTGLKFLNEALNVTTEQDKATLDYIKAIDANSNAGLYLNFESLRINSAS